MKVGDTKKSFSRPWSDIKEDILRGMDIELAYEELGIRWCGPKGPNGRGCRVCRSMDREDVHPSACVFLESGYYHDSCGGISLSFFDFAMKYGKFQTWMDMIRHYAGRACVSLGDSHEKKPSNAAVLEAVYEYRDADSSLKYGVFRYREPDGSKTFRQYPWDASGARWVCREGCMSGVKPLPYRLNQIAWVCKPIYVVEGEKDADRLAGVGFLATTSHGGAGNLSKTWKDPEFAKWFRERDVVVIPDRDTPGLKFAEGVCNALYGVSRSIKLLDLGEGKDVTDWLSLGHTGDDLLEMTRDAGFYKPDVEPADPVDVNSYGIWASSIAEEDLTWLMEGYFPKGGLSVFAGQGGVGKTLLLCDLTARVTSGGEVWNADAVGECFSPGNVLFISGEDKPSTTLVPRIRVHGGDLTRVRFLSREGLQRFMMGDGCVEFVVRELDAMGGADLVIIDPPSAFIGTVDGKRVDTHCDSDIRRVLGPLNMLAEDRNITVILNTHINKANGKGIDAQMRVMGSAGIVNAARAAYYVGKDPEDPKQRVFAHLKVNLSEEPQTLLYRILKEGIYPKIEWLGPVEMTADEALNGRDQSASDRDRNDALGRKIQNWLISCFAKTSTWEVSALEREFKKRFVRGKTSYMANIRTKLGMVSRKIGRNWVITWEPTPEVIREMQKNDERDDFSTEVDDI